MEFYRPWAQENFTFMSMAVRSQMDTQSVTQQVQRALTQIDPTIALAQPQSMEDVVRLALGEARLMMYLLGIFAGVALLLATVGIYGAVAYTVEQRTGEIGVRMALGAQRSDVLRLVVGHAAKLVGIGTLIGLLLALFSTRTLSALLYDVGAFDAGTFIFVTIALAAIAVLASYIPALRATRADPMIALSHNA
jgi:ABC-type antimicrobial peptide transport system permease subunit